MLKMRIDDWFGVLYGTLGDERTVGCPPLSMNIMLNGPKGCVREKSFIDQCHGIEMPYCSAG